MYSEVCSTFSLTYHSEVSIIVIHFEFLSTGYTFTNRKVCGHYAMVYLPLFCVYFYCFWNIFTYIMLFTQKTFEVDLLPFKIRKLRFKAVKQFVFWHVTSFVANMKLRILFFSLLQLSFGTIYKWNTLSNIVIKII